MCKFGKTLIVTFRAKYPFFLGTTADAKAQPFVNPTVLIRHVLIDAVFIGTARTIRSLILLLSELLPQFVCIFSPHIDGT